MNRRRARVANEVRDGVAAILEARIEDPRLRGVTLTGVEISADLGFARVFFYAPGEQRESQQAFERAKPFIRHCLGKRLRLRRVPELDFRLDPSLDKAERIEEILRELKEESG